MESVNVDSHFYLWLSRFSRLDESLRRNLFRTENKISRFTRIDIGACGVLLSALLFFMSPAHASVHFVSPTGTASWAQSVSSSTPCSLALANTNASAGDTVNLLAGTYSGVYIKPANSGTAVAPIVFQNYNNQTVTITNADFAILLSGKSYIQVRGINFYNLRQFLHILNRSSHNTFSHCTFDKARDTTVWSGSWIYGKSQSNRILRCSFSRWGYISMTRQFGSLFAIGANVVGDSSYYNLVEDSEFYFGGHDCFWMGSKFCIIRNNYIHNEPWPNNKGYRGMITEGFDAGYNLFEGNRFAFADYASGLSLRSEKNILRFNAFYGNGYGGLQIVRDSGGVPADDNRIYNNVFYHNGYSSAYTGFQGGIYLADWRGAGDPAGNVIKNNIFYNNKGPAVTYDNVTDPQVFENNWTTGDPLFVNDESLMSPANPGLPDFRLQSTSGCIDSGASLTRIISPSSGGTQFLVADARYFMDGWGMIQGDLIQLEGKTQQTRITHVDYAANRITVASAITWVQNQGIGLAYLGKAPDLGAFEYVSGPGIQARNASGRNAIAGLSALSLSSVGFFLTKEAEIKLAVYDVAGKQVRILLSGRQKPGIHKVALGDKGLRAGIRFVRLEAGNVAVTKKIVSVE